ncbi:nitrate reductase molybdenum cofactor assembly chaperone [Lentibacillus sediminis]|uniref:nitrate reductase molybdenum cofactor assembly chaperone n=1 Tax=Lentibacillus sediminis TaxID=1940529 RepID=UPI000C1B90E6|nr:nitrate reductase molybdenum cofactor assembly chaperone [Lentibacillus sediminis]
MKRTEINKVYQLLSFLMQYPDRQMKEALLEVKEEISRFEHPEVKMKLERFIAISEDTELEEWIDYYIENFDFGRVTNLYVTYLKSGEQRERGLELLKLKKFYEASGFTVTDKELTDYLPLMLEFCGQVPAETIRELMQMNAKAILEIHEKLRETSNYYTLLFDALLLTMEAAGVEISEPKEEQATP